MKPPTNNKKIPNTPIGKGLKPPTAPALPSGQVNQSALPGAVQTPATAPQGTGLLAGVAAAKFLGRGKKKSSVPKTLNKQIQLANAKGNLRKLAFSTSNAMTTSNMIKTNFKLPPMTSNVSSNTSVMQTAILMTTMTNQFKKLMEAGSSKNSAFRKLAKKYHPNKGGTKEQMQLLQSLKNNKKLNKEIQALPEPPKNMKKLLNKMSNQTPKRKGLIEKATNSEKKTVNFAKKLREKVKEEAKRKAKEEANKKVKEEAKRKAKEEANKKAKEKATNSGKKTVNFAKKLIQRAKERPKTATGVGVVGTLGVGYLAGKGVKKLTRTQTLEQAGAAGKKQVKARKGLLSEVHLKFYKNQVKRNNPTARGRELTKLLDELIWEKIQNKSINVNAKNPNIAGKFAGR